LELSFYSAHPQQDFADVLALFHHPVGGGSVGRPIAQMAVTTASRRSLLLRSAKAGLTEDKLAKAEALASRP
jgi:hypothetical protein